MTARHRRKLSFQQNIRRLIHTAMTWFKRNAPERSSDTFVKINDAKILSADIDQSTFDFDPACMTIALVAVLHEKNPCMWKKHDMTNIIAHGNFLYNRIVSFGCLTEVQLPASCKKETKTTISLHHSLLLSNARSDELRER